MIDNPSLCWPTQCNNIPRAEILLSFVCLAVHVLYLEVKRHCLRGHIALLGTSCVICIVCMLRDMASYMRSSCHNGWGLVGSGALCILVGSGILCRKWWCTLIVA